LGVGEDFEEVDASGSRLAGVVGGLGGGGSYCVSFVVTQS